MPVWQKHCLTSLVGCALLGKLYLMDSILISFLSTPPLTSTIDFWNNTDLSDYQDAVLMAGSLPCYNLLPPKNILLE